MLHLWPARVAFLILALAASKVPAEGEARRTDTKGGAVLVALGDAEHVVSCDGGVTWSAEDSHIAARTLIGRDSRPLTTHDGERFLSFAFGIWASPDGVLWQRIGERLPVEEAQVLQVHAFASVSLLIVFLKATGLPEAEPALAIRSLDGGRTWEPSSYHPSCAPSSVRGGVNLVGRTLLIAGERTCRSLDLGSTWTRPVGFGDTETGALFADEHAFYRIVKPERDSAQVWRSIAGDTWTMTATFATPLVHGTYADGAYIVSSSDGLFRGTDGYNWSEVSLPDNFPSAQVRELRAIRGACPDQTRD